MVFHLLLNLIRIIYAGMLKRFFRKKCFLMLVSANIVRQRKLIILGMSSFSWFLFCMSVDAANDTEEMLLFLPPVISSTVFCCAHLAVGQRMIETITAIRDWILLVLCLVAYLEWFVNWGMLWWSFHLKKLRRYASEICPSVYDAAIQKVDQGCEILCSEGFSSF